VVSLLAGLLGAAVLTLIVFGGGREHVITASALMAWAAGWGLLAVLSSRYTEQPQRWALVPAVCLAATALVVFVVGRSNGVMHALGWVWPPLLFALAVWTAIQIRRDLHSWTRLLLYPVVAFLMLVSVGGMVEIVQERSDYAMPGRLVAVGGHRLHINCTGSGSPTVVLEPGAGSMSSAMAWIAPAVARGTRVCVYDRAGRGWSESASGPQDANQTAADLHTLLAQADVPGPYVLAGHSFGGLYVQAFAARYPDDVAGLVLIDATPPDAFTSLPDYPTTYWVLKRVSAIAQSGSRFGLGRLINASSFGDLPSSVQAEVRADAARPQTARTNRDEFAVARRSMAQARALRSFGAKPLIVLTASDGSQAGWRAAQDHLATLSTNSVHRVVRGSTHESLIEDERDAAEVSRAIDDVVRAARDAASLSQP
jgi:pimeloyl-ACP methyl ester carboxylesterase